MSQTILSPQQLSSQSSIVNAMVQEAVQRKVITLADIAKSPEELVERVRPHAEASMQLQNYCKQVLEEQSDPGARLVAQAVYTALRANVMYAVAYRYHIQKAKPENKDINIADFKHTINLASIAYVSGNSYIHNGRVVPKEDYEILSKNIACDNVDWIGTHAIATILMDTIVSKLSEQIDLDKANMPKGYSSALSLLKIRIKHLLTDSRSYLGNHINNEVVEIYPFIHEEWCDADVSGMYDFEPTIYEHFHSKIETTRKALTIAIQKQREELPQVRAYIYILQELVGAVILKMTKLENAAQKEIGTPQKAHFHKEWLSVTESVYDLRRVVCKKELTISGEWATKAVELCEDLVSDATKKMPVQIVRQADLNSIQHYSDMAIGCIAARLRSGKGLPLSWVLAMRRIMGNKEDFRLLMSQLSNKKLLRQLPVDDPIDIMEYMTETMSQYQDVKLVPSEDEDDFFNIAVQQTEEKTLRKAVGRIVLFREYLLTEKEGTKDYIPTDIRERNKNYLTRLIYHDHGTLSYDSICQMLLLFETKADLLRALKEIGPMGDRSRRALNKITVSKLSERGEELAADTYRKRGYTIPTGYEHIFLQELRALAQQPEKK